MASRFRVPAMGERFIPAGGWSMLPAIPSGSILRVVRVRTGDIAVGDVICYLGAQAPLVAHRVIDIRTTNGVTGFLARGDSTVRATWVKGSAVVGVVREVHWWGLRYRTDGPIGRLLIWLNTSAKMGRPRLSRVHRLLTVPKRFLAGVTATLPGPPNDTR